MARARVSHTVEPLQAPEQFETWFAAAHAAYAISGELRPVGKAARDKLRLPRFRNGQGSAKLPKSLNAVLAAHRHYQCWDAPLVAKLPGAREKYHFAAATLAAALSDDGDSLPEGLDADDLPALVELPTGGVQRVYLYVAGDRDGDGEYPAVVLEEPPALTLRYASLAHYLTRELSPRLAKAGVCPSFDVDSVFAKAMSRAKKRCTKLLQREGLAAVDA